MESDIMRKMNSERIFCIVDYADTGKEDGLTHTAEATVDTGLTLDSRLKWAACRMAEHSLTRYDGNLNGFWVAGFMNYTEDGRWVFDPDTIIDRDQWDNWYRWAIKFYGLKESDDYEAVIAEMMNRNIDFDEAMMYQSGDKRELWAPDTAANIVVQLASNYVSGLETGVGATLTIRYVAGDFTIKKARIFWKCLA